MKKDFMDSKLRRLLKKSVLFQGGYDCQNTGDDAFAAVCAWGAKYFWETEKVKFLKKTLPEIPTESKTLLSSNPCCHLQTVAEMTYHISANPVLIFGGGSVFFQAGGGVWKLCKILSQLKKLRAGAIGVSLGPYRSDLDRKAVQETLKHFSFLVLRDSASYEDACDMNLPYEPVEGFDLAALLPQVYPLPSSKTHPDRPVIGISICHYERYVGGSLEKEKAREKKLLEMLKHIASKADVAFRFLVFNGNTQKGDAEVTQWMADQLGETLEAVEIVPYSTNPYTMWKTISECNVMIATRLHSGIFSYMADIPFLQVEYHKKCTDFVDVIGYPQGYRLGDMTVCPEEGAQKVLAVIESQNINYQNDKTQLIEKAELNFTSF